MELLVFILVRHLPQLNTRVKESPSHVPLRPQRLPEESARLVANTVSILAELPSLCSPAGEAWGKCTHTSKHARTYACTHTKANLSTFYSNLNVLFIIIIACMTCIVQVCVC